MNAQERFRKTLAFEQTDRPPLWLMRQAGRYLPEYQKIRKQHDFWQVCHTPTLSTQVALEPLRAFQLDAAIVFSDILVIPQALGTEVLFNSTNQSAGPVMKRKLQTTKDLEQWDMAHALEKLMFVAQAVKDLKQNLNNQYGLVGFAGAPFTLFAYMAEGGSSDDFIYARKLLLSNPKLVHQALEQLATIIAELLVLQIKEGVDVVQIFDTWGGLLSSEDYQTFCVPAIQRIAKRVHQENGKILLFVKAGHHLLPVLNQTHCDGFSLDWRTGFAEARQFLPHSILQGNIDPLLLFGSQEQIKNKLDLLFKEIEQLHSGKGIILNLGHGIMPETPVHNVEFLCRYVHQFRFHQS